MNVNIHNRYDNVNIHNRYNNVWINNQYEQALGDRSRRGRRSHTSNQPQEHQQEEPIDDCPICLTRCSLQLNYQCNHLFCQACIMQWNQQCRISQRQCLCPLCRSL